VKTGQEVTLPVLPELQAEIDRAPMGMTFLVTQLGKPFTAAGFGIRFRKWCDAAGLPHCTAHGLRKAGATRAAEAGASEKQLNALFGWGDNSNEARRYTRTARRKTLAGEAAQMLKSVPRNEPWDNSANLVSEINGKK
jgi:integrase